MLEAIKAFFLSPAFWTLLGSMVILFVKSVFPEVPLSGEDLWKVWAAFMAMIGIGQVVSMTRAVKANTLALMKLQK